MGALHGRSQIYLSGERSAPARSIDKVSHKEAGVIPRGTESKMYSGQEQGQIPLSTLVLSALW